MEDGEVGSIPAVVVKGKEFREGLHGVQVSVKVIRESFSQLAKTEGFPAYGCEGLARTSSSEAAIDGAEPR